MKKTDLEELKNRLASMVEPAGFELAEIAAPMAGGRLILRLFIHSPAGVTLDDCATVSRIVSEKLDREDPIGRRYTLEVSSLGLDRPLLTTRDFERRVGETVQIAYNEAGIKKSITGILKDVAGNVIVIENEDGVTNIPVDANPRGKIII